MSVPTERNAAAAMINACEQKNERKEFQMVQVPILQQQHQAGGGRSPASSREIRLSSRNGDVAMMMYDYVSSIDMIMYRKKQQQRLKQVNMTWREVYGSDAVTVDTRKPGFDEHVSCSSKIGKRVSFSENLETFHHPTTISRDNQEEDETLASFPPHPMITLQWPRKSQQSPYETTYVFRRPYERNRVEESREPRSVSEYHEPTLEDTGYNRRNNRLISAWSCCSLM